MAAGGTKSLRKPQASPDFLDIDGSKHQTEREWGRGGGGKSILGDLELPTTQKTTHQLNPHLSTRTCLQVTAVLRSLQHPFEWFLYSICHHMQHSNKDYFHGVNKINTETGSLDVDFSSSSPTHCIIFSPEVNAGYHNCGQR